MFALGGLSEEEAAAFEEHLMQCTECRAAYEELRDVVGVLPFVSVPMEPPAGMKARVLSNILEKDSQTPTEAEQPAQRATVKTEERSIKTRTASMRLPRWSRYGLAGLSAAVLLLGVYVVQLRGELDQTRKQLEVATGNLSDPFQLNKAVQLAPAAEGLVASGLASIVIDAKGTHLIVQAENLPELEGTEAFQVWLLKDGQPTNAGTFISQEGTGALMFTFEPNTYDTVAITQEPDPNGTTPRGSIILAAALES
jgi:anti-sigma factor RsiW